MTEPTGPLPPSVYRRRRALAVAVATIALVGLAWLVAVLSGDPDPAAPRPVDPTPAAPPVTPAAAPSTAPGTTAPTPPPGPPPPCEDAQLHVVAELDEPAVAAGEGVGLAIAVSNAGQLPCAKDIGRHVRELVVTAVDGGTRLWSSNDCFATGGSEVRVLRPGERFTYGLRWSGTTSEPGCGGHRRLGPGDYLLVAKVAGKASDPVVFRLT
ncbi:hypothetical protein [Saccharothrix xinjiangensis]|uniref:Intracellular proteinase inhibitor BsuPI n=1 Tax=Saccharothrix xinjiangensis TaxID=204798 RepID=A0ABV9XZF1_9PSEU